MGISLYFHLPFCRRKCPYCHFFVLPEKDSDKDLLQRALLSHLKKLSPKFANCTIPSIYFGGGTPTLFGSERIDALLRNVHISNDCEITIEANPDEITDKMLSGYRSVGINRLSIGIQTLDDSLLKALGRTHSAEKARQAVFSAHRVGFKNISIDLMYELPGQTLESFQQTIQDVVKWPITHLSLYNLTFEPNTSFYKHRNTLQPLLPSSEVSLAMLQYAVETLEKAGLKRYEISAFAQEGYASIHNSGYWEARPFLGLGPSAFSYYEGKRFRNHSHLRRYADTLDSDFEESLPYPDNVKELFAVELRLIQGVDLEAFEMRHAFLPLETHQQIKQLIQEGFLIEENKRVRLSSQGLLFYDSVATRLI